MTTSVINAKSWISKSCIIAGILASFIFSFPGESFASPKIYISNDHFNLGPLKEGRVYNYNLYIENKGDSILLIKSISVSCGCIKIISPKKPSEIEPGKKQEVKFSIDTTGFLGDITKHIYIYSNDTLTDPKDILVKGRVEETLSAVIEKFSAFGFGTIATAGLLDGINPCAFTVLIFFISYLSFAGYNKRNIIVSGISFIAAVFITYFLIGLGIFKFFQSASFFKPLANSIYLITAGIVFILGIVNTIDYLNYRKTHSLSLIKLQLPSYIKNIIHKVIRTELSLDKDKQQGAYFSLKLILITFICGILISVLESVCTGQVYVPIIVYVLKITSLKAMALFYLFLYNLCFIVPLLLIFIFMLFGIGSEQFASFSKRHLGAIKLFTAGFFFLLGILLLYLR